MLVHIFTIVWNEELILPHFFKHYRRCFKNVKFTVYDNMSTDNTRKIVLEHGAELLDYDTKGEIRSDLQIPLKNNCWKSSDADWIIVCDVDEWLDCNDEFIERTDCTIVKAKGYNMIGLSYNLDKIRRGTGHHWYNKCILFKKSAIEEINYAHGSHKCKPTGNVVYNAEQILLYHMKYFHPLYYINRQRMMARRVSDYNKKNKLSYHYTTSILKSVYRFLKVYKDSKEVRRVV